MFPKNKFIKPQVILSLAAATALVLSSCSKSFIDAKSNLLGNSTGGQLWKTPSDAQMAVNTIYGNLRSWNNVAFAAVILENIPSDDAEKGSTANDATFINQYDNFSVTPTEGQFNGFWTEQYLNINFCNQVLDHVDTMSAVSTAQKTRFLAEAKFIRAYSYFRLVRAFGRVPLVLHVPSTPAELNPKQNTSAEVYAQIESDLNDAAAGLPSKVVASEAGRASQGAAWALHAKVAMYQKKWNDVLTYTNNVINSGVYSLFPSFYDQFRIANENNSESIFEIQCNFIKGNDDISNSQYSQIQGNRDANAGWGFNVPTQNLVNEFETGDPRLQATVMMQGTTTPSGDVVPMAAAGAPVRYNMKSYVPFSLAVLDNQGADQNIRVIRYADVLLMNAEANNELGNAQAALVSLEQVRARARGNNTAILPKVTTTDQSALRTAIYHERRVELAMENDRYFDVIRQGRAATVFGPLGWKANKNEVWPIPQTQIDISQGLLTQNPGY